jgi:hypothetical protein
MQITNNSTKHYPCFSIENNDFHIIFDKVAVGPVPGSISCWSDGVCTGLIGKNKAQEALQLMRELEVEIIANKVSS